MGWVTVQSHDRIYRLCWYGKMGLAPPKKFVDPRVVLSAGRPLVVLLDGGNAAGGRLWEYDLTDGTVGRSGYSSADEYARNLNGDYSAITVEKPSLKFGHFHRRIAWLGCRVIRRDTPETWDGGRPYESFFQLAHTKECQAAHVSSLPLYQRLAEVFELVEPSPTNGSTYGHALRHLLILACTEVESAWRGVLTAQGYGQDRLTTNDYVKLRPVLRLNEWRVSLLAYPEWPALSPFEQWDPKDPTTSLPWYDAYNNVKHDREGRLHLATLEHVVSAMAAVTILGWAQFGEDLVGIDMVPHTALFRALQRPQWGAHQVYFGPKDGEPPDWVAVPYEFA